MKTDIYIVFSSGAVQIKSYIKYFKTLCRLQLEETVLVKECLITYSVMVKGSGRCDLTMKVDNTRFFRKDAWTSSNEILWFHQNLLGEDGLKIWGTRTYILSLSQVIVPCCKSRYCHLHIKCQTHS